MQKKTFAHPRPQWDRSIPVRPSIVKVFSTFRSYDNGPSRSVVKNNREVCLSQLRAHPFLHSLWQKLPKLCFSGGTPVTQLPVCIVQLCLPQQRRPPVSSPVALTRVGSRWSQNLTGRTLRFIPKLHQTGQLLVEASARRPC